MSVVLFIAIAVGIGAGCVGLSWAHVRRVEAAASPELRAIAAAIRKMPAGERLGELSRRARAGSFEQGLAAVLIEARDEGAQVAAVNEALDDIEVALAEGQKWPASAARIAAWGTMLVGVAAFLAQVGAPILAIAGVGVASTIACLSAMRRADGAAREQREAVDALVTALLGRAAQGDEGAGSLPRRRLRSASRASGPSRKRIVG